MLTVRAAALAGPRCAHVARPRVSASRPAVPTLRVSKVAAPATPVAAVRTVRVFAKKDEKEPERDEDGLYYGEYSNFWSDPEQFKGIVIFSAVLASFFSLGNIGAALLLPWLYNKPIELCFQALVLGYPCAGQ